MLHDKSWYEHHHDKIMVCTPVHSDVSMHYTQAV